MNISYKQALWGLIILQCLYFSPLLLQGQVIFPHNNKLEISGLATETPTSISNRKFSDQSSVYIPEINLHLNGQYHSWLSTWNPHVQLGRPTFQMAGFSKAYLLTHILSIFTKNPFSLYTYLTVLTVYLTGLFCFLLLKSLNLHPLACFSSAAGLSLGTFFAYWFTFVMFLASICWTLALLWFIVEFTEQRLFWPIVGIAFASYSLLMTGNPQTIVMHAYLIAGFALIRFWRSSQSRKIKFYSALALAGAALFGAVMALPPYLDLITNAQRSARLNVGDEFFLAVLPPLQNGQDLILFLSQLFDAFWFGNTIRPEYPFIFNGLSLTPFYFSLVLLSLTDYQWRRLWPWQLFAAACVLATIWSPAYLFMVHYMGFHLSRAMPLGGGLIPGFVLAGYALDHILRTGLKQSVFSGILLIGPLLLSGINDFNQYSKLHIGYVVICFILMLGTGWFIISRKPVLLVFLSVSSVWAYGYSIMLTRPMIEIQVSSPLTEKIKLETDDGSRYALIGQDLNGILPSNQEALLQIKSIHSYDSLSSVNYQHLVQELSEVGTTTYGRHFNNISSDAKLGQAPFSYTGARLLLSRHELDKHLFKETGEINGIKFYQPLTSPMLKAQLTSFEKQGNNQVIVAGYLSKQAGLKFDSILTMDDFMQFKVTPADQETLLFVSQQYHPYWQATTQGKPLPTVLINDFYLGAIIPPHVTDIELQFRPFVLWSWIPQVIYIALGLGLLTKWVRTGCNGTNIK